MKKIIICLFAVVLYSQISFAQYKGNPITLKEYYAIEINDITILDLIRTNGDYSKLKLMFGNDLQYKTIDSPNSGVEF